MQIRFGSLNLTAHHLVIGICAHYRYVCTRKERYPFSLFVFIDRVETDWTQSKKKSFDVNGKWNILIVNFECFYSQVYFVYVQVSGHFVPYGIKHAD